MDLIDHLVAATTRLETATMEALAASNAFCGAWKSGEGAEGLRVPLARGIEITEMRAEEVSAIASQLPHDDRFAVESRRGLAMVESALEQLRGYLRYTRNI